MIDAQDTGRTYSYTFSVDGSLGGSDDAIAIDSGVGLGFAANFAEDFADKYGTPPAGDVILRLRSSADFAEADPVDGDRTTDVRIDDVAVYTLASACPEDTNCDLNVDVDDLVNVIIAWGNSDPAADVNGSGTVDVDDLVAVILKWGACF